MFKRFLLFATIILTVLWMIPSCTTEDTGGSDDDDDNNAQDVGPGQQDLSGSDTSSIQDTLVPDVGPEQDATPEVTPTPEVGPEVTVDIQAEPVPEVTVTLTGRVLDIVSQNPVTDVSVCVYEHPEVPCALTANGEYTLEDVPGHTRLFIEYTKSSYFPTIAEFETTDTDESWVFMLASTAAIELQALLLGLSVDSSTGQIVFAAFDSSTGYGQSGVSMSLSPSSGTIMYSGDEGIPETRSDTSSLGAGGFLNVEPGTYTLTYDFPGGSCWPYFGWEASGSNTVEVRVEAGIATFVSQYCGD